MQDFEELLRVCGEVEWTGGGRRKSEERGGGERVGGVGRVVAVRAEGVDCGVAAVDKEEWVEGEGVGKAAIEFMPMLRLLQLYKRANKNRIHKEERSEYMWAVGKRHMAAVVKIVTKIDRDKDRARRRQRQEQRRKNRKTQGQEGGGSGM